MRSTYLASTPYNVFQFLLLALEKNEAADLLLYHNFAGATNLKQTVEQWPHNPFDRVYTLQGKFNLNGTFEKWRTTRENVRTIRQYVLDREPTTVYVCSENKVEEQALLHYACNHPEGATPVFVEGGLDLYVLEQERRLSLRRRLVGRIMNGLWWRPITERFTASQFSLVCASYPMLIPDVPDSLRTEELPVGIARSSRFREWAESVASAYDVPLLDAASDNVLIVLAHSVVEEGSPDYVTVVRDIIHDERRKGSNVLVKYHPRETCQYMGDLGEEVTTIPRALPLEVLYTAYPSQLKKVVGDYSTSLMTATYLLNSPQVSSFAQYLPPRYPSLIEMFERIGINPLRVDNPPLAG